MVDNFSSLFMYFNQSEVWKQKAEQLGLGDTDSIVIIGCSGGPDSVFLALYIYRFRHIVKCLPLSITKILHVVHTCTPSDIEAEKLIKMIFENSFELIIENISSEKKVTETYLRKKRKEVYENTLQKFYSALQSVNLCLGHHQDDRIENAFLHMERGTGIQGICNMQEIEKKYLHNNGILREYILIRPLLFCKKHTLENLCLQHRVPFIKDIHNEDITQKRIQIRKSISTLLNKQKKQFYGDREYVFQYGGKKEEYYFQSVFYSPLWDIKTLYCGIIPDTIPKIIALFTLCGVYKNISTKRLTNFLQCFYKKSGSLFLYGWWFLRSYEKMYFTYTGNNYRFWEHYNDIKVDINHSGEYQLGGFTWIIDETKIGKILGFYKQGEIFGQKGYMKWCNEMKVPFFRRRSLPIIKINNIIDTVLPQIDRPWINE